MNEIKVGIIRENIELNRWEVLVDDKVISHTKTLAWIKGNIRKSVKIRKAGVRIFDVFQNGETIRCETFSPYVHKPRGMQTWKVEQCEMFPESEYQ